MLKITIAGAIFWVYCGFPDYYGKQDGINISIGGTSVLIAVVSHLTWVDGSTNAYASYKIFRVVVMRMLIVGARGSGKVLNLSRF